MNDTQTQGVWDANPSPTERTRIGCVRPFGVGFTLRDHTADVAAEADGESPGAVLATVADGLTAAMCDDPAETSDRLSLAVRTEGREALLPDYPDRPIYERDVRGVLPAAHEAAVRLEGDEWVVEASTRGVPFADVDARDVRAVTYPEMRLMETDAGWEAYVVSDV